MADTQWPRYEVFKQDNERKAHEAVGSVHAPDAELALLNARNVFVRRPSAVSLWVVPESAIFSMTAQELEHQPYWGDEAVPDQAAEQVYLIFTKSSQRRAMTFVKHEGAVTATTAQQALQRALADEALQADEVFVWWVVPDWAITRSDADAPPSWFAPAQEKVYRQQSYYGFVGGEKQRRRSRGAEQR